MASCWCPQCGVQHGKEEGDLCQRCCEEERAYDAESEAPSDKVRKEKKKPSDTVRKEKKKPSDTEKNEPSNTVRKRPASSDDKKNMAPVVRKRPAMIGAVSL